MNTDRFTTTDAKEVPDDNTPSEYERNAARILEQLGDTIPPVVPANTGSA